MQQEVRRIYIYNEWNNKNANTNRVMLKNFWGQCPSSGNKIIENSVNEREISVRNTIVIPHKIQI